MYTTLYPLFMLKAVNMLLFTHKLDTCCQAMCQKPRTAKVTVQVGLAHSAVQDRKKTKTGLELGNL